MVSRLTSSTTTGFTEGSISLENTRTGSASTSCSATGTGLEYASSSCSTTLQARILSDRLSVIRETFLRTHADGTVDLQRHIQTHLDHGTK